MTTPVSSVAGTSRTARDSVWFPLLVFLAVAMVLFVTVEVSHDHLRAEHPPSPRELSTLGRWYSGWMVFDTAWYVYLAEHGYDARQEELFDGGKQSAIAYFPAYPLTVRAVARLDGHDYGAAAMLVTFSCGLAFALLFWYWCRDRLSTAARRTAVVLLLVYPYAWFLYGSGYSDAFFLAATISAFLLLDRDHPVLAGLAGFLALAARPTGTAVLIGLVAVALERRGVLTRDPSAATEAGDWWTRERARWHFNRERFQARDAGVLLAAGGLLSYMYFSFVNFGDAFAFATVQKAPGWNQPAGFHTWFKIGFFSHLVHDSPGFSLRLVAQLLLTAAFLVGSLLVLRRFGWGYAVYALAIVVIPMLGSGDFQGMGRYLLGCFPVFAAVGAWLAAPQRQSLRRGVVIVSATTLIALASLFGRRYYLT